jgi:hypothetical protein
MKNNEEIVGNLVRVGLTFIHHETVFEKLKVSDWNCVEDPRISRDNSANFVAHARK